MIQGALRRFETPASRAPQREWAVVACVRGDRREAAAQIASSCRRHGRARPGHPRRAAAKTKECARYRRTPPTAGAAGASRSRQTSMTLRRPGVDGRDEPGHDGARAWGRIRRLAHLLLPLAGEGDPAKGHPRGRPSQATGFWPGRMRVRADEPFRIRLAACGRGPHPTLADARATFSHAWEKGALRDSARATPAAKNLPRIHGPGVSSFEKT